MTRLLRFQTAVARLFVLFGAAVLLASCGWFQPKVVGTLDSGFSAPRSLFASSHALSGGLVEELWLVSLERGSDSVVYPGAVQRADVFAPRRNGDFSISIPSTGGEYAIIAARPSEPDRKDEIVAVFSFRVDASSGSMILPTGELTGTFEMGRVRFNSGQGVSERSVNDNAGALTADAITLLRSIADADNSVIALVNDHVNYRSQSDYYVPELTLGYGGPTLSAIASGTASSTDFTYSSLGVWVFSPDATTPLTFRSPSGVLQGSSGNYGSESAVKWGMNSTDPSIEPGWWQLLNADTSTILAEFNLNLGFPLDQDGVPISPVPLPRFELNGSGDVVGMTFQWVSSDGSETMNLDDLSALDLLVGKTEFFIDVRGNYPQQTYMFDEIRGEQNAPRMFGDLRGFTLSEPFDLDETTEMIVSYRFGFYRISVGFRT